VKIRVEAKDHRVVSLELSGEWRAEPVDLHCLVGPTVSHYFTPDGFYDHAEPRPEARRPEEAGASTIENNPAGENKRRKPAGGLDVGPADGTACVPGA
jgi:hypothetical protein